MNLLDVHGILKFFLGGVPWDPLGGPLGSPWGPLGSLGVYIFMNLIPHRATRVGRNPMLRAYSLLLICLHAYMLTYLHVYVLACLHACMHEH